MTLPTPGTLIAVLRSRLQGRPDTEHVMSLNRAIFCAVMATYIGVLDVGPPGFGPVLLVAGWLIAAALFLHLLAYPAPNVLRRTVAVAVDIGTIALVMHIGDEPAAIFFPLMLWTVFGNGFRFGVQALWIATGAGLVAFGLMAATTPFWFNNLSLTVGLEIGMLMVPAYASVLVKRLTRAKARAEAANEAKSAFLANVSHELRTPLQAIIGANSLLGRSRLMPDQAGLLATASNASQSLLAMIDDVLKLSMIEARRTDIQLADFNVADLMQDVRQLMLVACREKGLSLGVHIQLDAPLWVKADRRHIQEVLMNLAGNAIKFTPRGGVLLAASAPDPDGAGTVLEFEVIDTGIGVAPAMREMVFDRFTQADRTVSQQLGGTGLGLAICKGLVTAMGGTIGARDGRQPGSVFWFRVPVLPASAAPQPAPDLTPVTVILPNGPAKARIAKVVSEQGRDSADFAADGPSTEARMTEALGAGRVLVMETPGSEASRARMGSVLSRHASEGGAAVILVDREGQADRGEKPGIADDPRWLAPIRLHSRFTARAVEAALAIADRLAKAPARTAADSPPAAAPRHSHILVVDDNKTNQLIFTKMVESGGYVCRVAGDGEEALIVLERERFDLVLMDVNMPGIDGIEATKLQRVAELGSVRVPIIGITADASPDMAQKCRSAGMDDHLVKPVSTSALLHAIDQVLAQAAPHGRPAPPDPDAGADVDWQPLMDLEKLGGKRFVHEVVGEFIRDSREILDHMNLALTRARYAEVQSAAHALASTASNVGAVTVRRLGLELEKMPDLRIRQEGYLRAKAIHHAINRFLAALGDAGGKQPGSGQQPGI